MEECKGQAPTSAAAVANYFLELQEKEDDPDSFRPIDPMKLQKLLYFAHAWWLAIKGYPLFDEDIEAWPWGPVVRNVYLSFKEFGKNPIKGKRALELEVYDNDNLKYTLKEPPDPPDEVKDFLKAVWEKHKQYSGVQLSNATHARGEPWFIVKEEYGNLEEKPTIPNSLIKTVFKKKIQESHKGNDKD